VKRRRRLARKRRRLDLDAYRADDRQRQADLRARRSVGLPRTSPVSRATLSLKTLTLRASILGKWDSQMRRSRAAFVRQVRELFERQPLLLGQPETGPA